MIILLALAFRVFVSPKLIDEALTQADRGLAGRTEGHAAMDMSVSGKGPFRRRLLSPGGFGDVFGTMLQVACVARVDVDLGALGYRKTPRNLRYWLDKKRSFRD